MNKDIKIRKYKKTDLQEVIQLLNELANFISSEHEITDKNIRFVFQEMNKQKDFYKNFVIEFQSQIIGFISVIFYKTVLNKGGTALINELIIKTEYRGKGTGKKAINYIKELCSKVNMDELEVGTEKGNIKAQNFYKKCGFTEEYLLYGMDL